MIVFLTLLYVAALFLAVKIGLVKLNSFWKISPVLFHETRGYCIDLDGLGLTDARGQFLDCRAHSYFHLPTMGNTRTADQQPKQRHCEA